MKKEKKEKPKKCDKCGSEPVEYVFGGTICLTCNPSMTRTCNICGSKLYQCSC